MSRLFSSEKQANVTLLASMSQIQTREMSNYKMFIMFVEKHQKLLFQRLDFRKC